MGLDATIKRADGQPLGKITEVKQVLTIAFPGIIFETLHSGQEKIKAAAEQGIIFPDVILQHLETSPGQICGDYEGNGFSAQFNLGSSEIVHEIDGVLYGSTVASTPMLALLESRFGWVTTHP